MLDASQDHIANYNHTIAYQWRRLLRDVGNFLAVWLISLAVMYFGWGYLGGLGIMLVVFVITVVVGSLAVFTLLKLSDIARHLIFIYRQARYRSIALEHPPDVHSRVINAYNNVQPFLLSPRQARWTPRLFRKLFERYGELERIETNELRQRLEAVGVWNVNAKWHGIGRTIDEALMLAVYTGRIEGESAKSLATEKALQQKEAQAAAAPALQAKKERELEKQALKQEIGQYGGQETYSEQITFDTIGGSAEITRNGENETIAFAIMLPVGAYRVTVQKDGQKAMSEESEGEGRYDFIKASIGAIRNGEVVIEDLQNGQRERVPFW